MIENDDMKRRNITALLTMFRNSYAIDDDQLKTLISFYAPLERSLDLMGPLYELAWAQVSRDLRILRDWHKGRQIKRGDKSPRKLPVAPLCD